MIDLIRLTQVVAIAREGSFVKAASVLNLSQPALSRSIQTIERQYGVRIFERGRSGVQLTAVGARFLAVAEDLVSRTRSVDAELGLISSGRTGPVRFGLGPMSATFLAKRLAHRLFETDLRVEIKVGDDSTLRQLMLSGEIEFYFGGSASTTDFISASRFHVQSIQTGTVGALVRRGHPLLAAGENPDYSPYPVIGGSPMLLQIDEDSWLAHGLNLPSIQFDNYDKLAEICLNSDAILLAGGHIKSLADGLEGVPHALPLRNDSLIAHLVTFADQELTTAARSVIDLVISLYPEDH